MISTDDFLFASEIKALLANHSVTREPNHGWLYRFLMKGAVDWDEQTAFKGIFSLLPGHNMTINSDGSRILSKYWDLTNSQRVIHEPASQFRDLFEDAVRLRLLRSDVPVGSCLSGGLDSSSIVAIACSSMNHPMKTVSAEYAEPDCNETRFINMMAETFPIKSDRFTPTAKNFWETLESITWHLDEPSGAYGIYSQWFVFRAMAKQVRVALDGQGGDELLGGYYYYFESYLNDLFNLALKKRSRDALDRFWAVLEEAEILTGIDLYQRLERHYFPSSNGQTIFFPEYNETFGSNSRSEMLSDGPFADDLNQTLYHTFSRTSLPALLHFEDRISMAFSVEARLPFLDYRLVEYCFSLPSFWKIQDTTTKRVLREAMKDLLPKEIVQRRDKKGYATPMAQWFRNELRASVEELLSSRSFRQREILDPKRVLAKFHEHAEGRADHTWQIWRWISMEMWFREFIDSHEKALPSP